MRVVVVGAGVLGASAAHFLRAGGADVTLVEGSGAGSGTSSRGAGLVCEGMWHATSLALVRRTMAILEELGEEGSPFSLHRTGSTTLVPEPLADAARRMAQQQRSWGAQVEVLAPADAARLPRHERVRVDDAALALHYPRDGWAMPRIFCEILEALFAEARGRIVAKPASLRRAGDRVEVVAGGEALAADAVVVAAGVWTRGLLQQAGLDAPLVPYRTQAIRFTHSEAHKIPILHDAVQGFYLRPSWPGQCLVGNGTTTTPEDPSRWRHEADDAFRDASAKRLAHRVPGFDAARPTDAWAGLDAATPDRLLLAGEHPDAPGLWLLAGGNGHGFMRGPGAGESLAARILGRAPPVDLAPYDPARFRDAWSAPFQAREGYTLEP